VPSQGLLNIHRADYAGGFNASSIPRPEVKAEKAVCGQRLLFTKHRETRGMVPNEDVVFRQLKYSELPIGLVHSVVSAGYGRGPLVVELSVVITLRSSVMVTQQSNLYQASRDNLLYLSF
jgi:hypothetical protein|tara:strand:- start:3662 stop:4021 length:360 start_codon:yes stop_codon:yes gene_type:complete